MTNNDERVDLVARMTNDERVDLVAKAMATSRSDPPSSEYLYRGQARQVIAALVSLGLLPEEDAEEEKK